MRRVYFLLFILLIGVGPAAAEENFLVRIERDDASLESVSELIERLGLTLERRVRGEGDVYLVSADDLSESVVREWLASEKRIRQIEAVRELRLPETSEGDEHDTVAERARTFAASFASGRSSSFLYYGARVRGDYVRQPVGRRLRLRTAHRRFGAGAGVVAVIDTGVDPSHPALAGSLVPGYDFIRDESGMASEWLSIDPSTAASLEQGTSPILEQGTSPILEQGTSPILEQGTSPILEQGTSPILEQGTSPILEQGTSPILESHYRAFGHGTLVAGLIRFVAPRAKIMPLKAFRADGVASTADVVDAIYYAVEHGADVINMSFTFQTFSPEVMRAVNYATRNGVVCVSAAGNLGSSALVYPASFENVTGVAAMTARWDLSPISNFGEDLVSVAAPGEEVLSTYPGHRYASVFGTSFASAIVAGAVALLEQVGGPIDQHDAEAALAAGRSRNDELGYGHIDLMSALEWMRKSRSDDDDDDDD